MRTQIGNASITLNNSAYELLRILKQNSALTTREAGKLLRAKGTTEPVRQIVNRLNNAFKQEEQDVQITIAGEEKEFTISMRGTVYLEQPPEKRTRTRPVAVPEEEKHDPLAPLKAAEELSWFLNELRDRLDIVVRAYPSLADELASISPELRKLSSKYPSTERMTSRGVTELLDADNPEKWNDFLTPLSSETRTALDKLYAKLLDLEAFYRLHQTEQQEQKTIEDQETATGISEVFITPESPWVNNEIWDLLNSNQRGAVEQFAMKNRGEMGLGEAMTTMLNMIREHTNLITLFSNWDDVEGLPIPEFRKRANRALGINTSFGRSESGESTK